MGDHATQPPHIVRSRPADAGHRVVTVQGGGSTDACRVPCPQCPWRLENAGIFPAEAFRVSAPTAYDMADRTFGCHMSGVRQPMTCAGALMSTGAEHNLNVRMRMLRGEFAWDDVSSGDASLHPDYKSMAVANGVAPDDPSLTPCR